MMMTNTDPFRLLVVEGNSAVARHEAQADGMPTQSDLYVATLDRLAPGVACDIICPADSGSQLSGGSQLEDYAGIVWTGSSLNVYDRTPEIERQIELMQACFKRKVRIFGSCWGLQVAAVAAGGVVTANPKGREIGIGRNIGLTGAGKTHPMFEGKPAIFDSVAIHLDHVATAPEGCVVLASNDMSAIQAVDIKRGDAQFWGVQYHPEFDVPHIAKIMHQRGEMMVREGFCQNEADVERLTANLTAAATDTGRKDLRWRYGLGEDVLNPSRRLVEIANWLAMVRAES